MCGASIPRMRPPEIQTCTAVGVISAREIRGGDRGGAGRVGHFNCTEMVLLVE